MKSLLKVISYAGLALTLIPSFFVFYGKIAMNTNQTLMLAGMIMWFVTAPFWMKNEDEI